jgi:hypothetical protein
MGFGAAAFAHFASEGWWAVQGSNLRPLPCQGNYLGLCALATHLSDMRKPAKISDFL